MFVNFVIDLLETKMKLVRLFLPVLIMFGCANIDKNNYVESSGIVEATEVLISSKVNSQVLHILVEEGAQVNVGDTLAILDNEYFRYQLEQAVALEESAKYQLALLQKGARVEDIRQAEESFKQALENFEVAKINYERYKHLHKTNTISEKQFEEVELAYKLAESKLNQAKENLKKVGKFFRYEEIQQALANLKRAKSNVDLFRKYLNDCVLTSPLNGIVSKKIIEEGENVTVGFPMFKIAKFDTMEIIVYVAEYLLGKIKLGQTVEVKTDTYPNKIYNGKVVFISNEAEFTPKSVQTKDERTTLVFAVKIKIPNSNFELKSGMPADVRINISNF